jgi:hypothetical protein
MDRSHSDKRRYSFDGKDNARPKLKRRKTENGSISSSHSGIRRSEHSFLGFDSPGPYWRQTNHSTSAQTPKKKQKHYDTESPTKELRSKLERE